MVSAFRERAVGAATHFLPGWLTRETAVSCWRSRRGRRSPEENVKSRRHRKPPDMADIENLRTWPAQKLSSHGPSHGRTPSGTDRSSILILRIEGGTSADYRRLVMLATRGFGDLLQAQFLCLPWSPWEVRGWQLTAYHAMVSIGAVDRIQICPVGCRGPSRSWECILWQTQELHAA